MDNQLGGHAAGPCKGCQNRHRTSLGSCAVPACSTSYIQTSMADSATLMVDVCCDLLRSMPLQAGLGNVYVTACRRRILDSSRDANSILRG